MACRSSVCDLSPLHAFFPFFKRLLSLYPPTGRFRAGANHLVEDIPYRAYLGGYCCASYQMQTHVAFDLHRPHHLVHLESVYLLQCKPSPTTSRVFNTVSRGQLPWYMSVGSRVGFTDGHGKRYASFSSCIISRLTDESVVPNWYGYGCCVRYARWFEAASWPSTDSGRDHILLPEYHLVPLEYNNFVVAIRM